MRKGTGINYQVPFLNPKKHQKRIKFYARKHLNTTEYSKTEYRKVIIKTK